MAFGRDIIEGFLVTEIAFCADCVYVVRKPCRALLGEQPRQMSHMSFANPNCG